MNRNTAPRSVAFKKDSRPSPHHYADADVHWRKLSHNDAAKSATYTFVKEKSKTFTDHVMKAKKHVPSPNHYKKTSMTEFSKLSRGPPSTINKYKAGR
jgi:hypothetical protein